MSYLKQNNELIADLLYCSNTRILSLWLLRHMHFTTKCTCVLSDLSMNLKMHVDWHSNWKRTRFVSKRFSHLTGWQAFFHWGQVAPLKCFPLKCFCQSTICRYWCLGTLALWPGPLVTMTNANFQQGSITGRPSRHLHLHSAFKLADY